MTTSIAQHHQPPTAEEATRMTASWPDLLHSQIQTQAEADQITAAAKRLSVPATRQWISGRVATLLSQYFASSVPTEMMAAIAEDWHEELRTYPAWAVNKACRWWMSADNPDRRKRPVPGDIAARAKRIIGVVKIARNAVDRFERGAAPVQPNTMQDRCSPEAASEIMAAAGFSAKKMGGE